MAAEGRSMAKMSMGKTEVDVACLGLVNSWERPQLDFPIGQI
jgi:hypothetical protein